MGTVKVLRLGDLNIGNLRIQARKHEHKIIKELNKLKKRNKISDYDVIDLFSVEFMNIVANPEVLPKVKEYEDRFLYLFGKAVNIKRKRKNPQTLGQTLNAMRRKFEKMLKRDEHVLIAADKHSNVALFYVKSKDEKILDKLINKITR